MTSHQQQSPTQLPPSIQPSADSPASQDAPRPEPAGRWRQRLAAWLCGLQILGVSFAILLAASEIESICVTSPIFSLLGIVVAFGSRRSGSAANALFGSSALTVSLFCFTWIFALSMSPDDAAVPVSALLIAYEILAIPLGWLALSRTLRPLARQGPRDVRRWQFGIANMLGVTALLAVALSVARTVFLLGDSLRLAAAAGLFVLSLLGTAVVIVKVRLSTERSCDAARSPFTSQSPEPDNEKAS